MHRPEPLRTDGTNAFARFSMAVRVPRILRDTVEQGRHLPALPRDALLRLAEEIEADAPLPAPSPEAPDHEAWAEAHAEHAGESWQNGEWFHTELAVYREVATRVGFWVHGLDPFTPAKREEADGARLGTILEAALAGGHRREERLMHRLHACLWGNRIDLSYTVAADRERRDEDLLVDDSSRAVERLASSRDVHLVADNAATELALDLALVDAVLEAPDARVTVHVKAQPVFVSDALVADVEHLLDTLERRGGEPAATSRRLRVARSERRLSLVPDLFWTGPRFLWQAPPALAGVLGSADVVIVKGDANYRRVVGDAIWPPAATFADAASYLDGTVVCVRTLKSDALVGVPEAICRTLDAREPRWRIDGSRGVIQVAATTPSR